MNRRLLLAEDDASIAKLVEFKLKRAGWDVTHVADGDLAIQALQASDSNPTTTRFDAVILDVMMPGQDGWAVLSLARSLPNYRSTPIIILTARGQGSDAEQAASRGATSFVRKPFDPSTLLQTLDQSISASQPEGELTLQGIRQEFLNSLPDRLARLREGLSARDWERVRQESHQLSGSAITFGFEALASAAEAIENSRDSDWDQRAILFRELERVLPSAT